MFPRRSLLGSLAIAFAVRPVQAADAKVRIDNFTFTPQALTVPSGTTVTWTNTDDIPHTITSAAQPLVFRSKVLDTDDSYTRIFDTPGTYAYFCSLHPHMTGTVTVR